jgi:hypothetical protein
MKVLRIKLSDQDAAYLADLARGREWTGREWTAEDLASAIIAGRLRKRRKETTAQPQEAA